MNKKREKRSYILYYHKARYVSPRAFYQEYDFFKTVTLKMKVLLEVKMLVVDAVFNNSEITV
jgi:hypothetical protein